MHILAVVVVVIIVAAFCWQNIAECARASGITITSDSGRYMGQGEGGWVSAEMN